MPMSVYIQTAIFMVLALVALFLSAGTLAIPSFWIYLAIFAAGFVASFIWLDPDLARERMRPGGKKLPLALQFASVVLVLHWVVAGLDRGRFHWSDGMPTWLEALGIIAFAGSYAFCLWAMHVNRFFSSVVRIQSDRGQYVITTGPYALVRHPGYAAGAVFVVSSGIALGSWLATAVFAAFSLPFLMYRVITEDRVLQAELTGYRDYASHVRWRLLPGVW
jgi:protein-S-isoprenylcysteine O-methyltransferase Ste14